MNIMETKFQLYSCLDAFRQLLTPIQGDNEQVRQWLGQVEEQKKRLTEQKFQVAVLGEFKRGKSSFLNALLGRKILPTDILPTTAAINRVVFGQVPAVRLEFHDGSFQSIPIEELAQYVTKVDERAAKNASRIREAVVKYPCMFCRNNVELIDTPGLNDNENMTAVTLSGIRDVDLAVMVISAMYPFSETETQLAEQLLKATNVSQIVVVVTMMDQLEEEEQKRVIELLRQRIPAKIKEKLLASYPENDPIFDKYERNFGKLKLYGVSSKMAMQANQTNNMEKYQKSGFTELNQDLNTILVTGQMTSSVRTTTDFIQRLAYDIEHYEGKANSEQFKAISMAFAKASYGAMENTMKAWEKWYDVYCDAMDKKIKMISDQLEASWFRPAKFMAQRGGAVVAAMGETSMDLNNFLYEFCLTKMPSKMKEQAEKEFLMAAQVMEEKLEHANKENLLDKVRQLEKVKINLPQTNFIPFRWHKMPAGLDELTFYQTSKVKLDQHAFLMNLRNDTKERLLTYQSQTGNKLQKRITEVEKNFKAGVQKMVMDFFADCDALVRQEEEQNEKIRSEEVKQAVQNLRLQCKDIQQAFENQMSFDSQF